MPEATTTPHLVSLATTNQEKGRGAFCLKPIKDVPIKDVPDSRSVIGLILLSNKSQLGMPFLTGRSPLLLKLTPK